MIEVEASHLVENTGLNIEKLHGTLL